MRTRLFRQGLLLTASLALATSAGLGCEERGSNQGSRGTSSGQTGQGRSGVQGQGGANHGQGGVYGPSDQGATPPSTTAPPSQSTPPGGGVDQTTGEGSPAAPNR